MQQISNIKKVLQLMSIICLLFISTYLYSSDNFTNYYLKNLSLRSVKAHCEDKWLLEQTGYTKKECTEKLTEITPSCNELVKPLIPNNIDSETSSEEDLLKLRNIGELYSLCLLGNIYQNQDKKSETP